MSGRDRQDVDTSVGRGPGDGADTGPTAGHAGGLSEDQAIGLGGTLDPDALTAARGQREDAGGGFGTGLETGNASRGSPTNAATRVDTFNVPGEAPGRPR